MQDGVWCIAGVLAALRQGDVADLNILVGPLVEQLDAANLLDDVLGQDLVARDGLDLDLSVVRHAGRNVVNRIDEIDGQVSSKEILRWRLGVVGGRVGCVVVEDGRRSRSFFRLLWLVVVCLALWCGGGRWAGLVGASSVRCWCWAAASREHTLSLPIDCAGGPHYTHCNSGLQIQSRLFKIWWLRHSSV